ncbi:FtsH protease activity modulator HflK [Teredinibacter sp. KSP-S5-2]|uniref:FtsH protease activity modulator HflK n=1 Tax=Teredinibacter sp. KSP-S5-2 TaxID=3034506 RepID=UPI002934D459|nr:FtsH protease activity modulator HflK [Teredinibacter sp. KSP-S5-2]WNO08171.1 FtsH protease activity modulator HflK [Teredinibacter sp. KSP-S5-2]
MAWNEPGGNKDKDPWSGGNRGNDGPPDLDEILNNLTKKFNGFFGGNGGRGGASGGSGFSAAIFALIFIVVGVFYVIKGAGIVNEQERAVVLRFGVYSETKGPGFRWNPPLIDNVYTVNVTKVRGWTTSEQMLTKDLNIVDIKLSVQYVIADARDFVLKVRDPESSLQQATNSALRHVAGSTGMHDVLTQGREQVALEVQERLQTYLDNYQTGIRIEKVNVEDSNPPREVQAAFDDVIKAREDEERFKNQAQAYANGIIPEARGKAQRVIEEANAYKEQVIAQAEGEAKRFELLLAEYKKAPQVTRKRLYIDAVQEVMGNASKVMVDVEGGNNMLYIPLDKVISSSSTSASKGFTDADIDTITNEVIDQLRREASNNSRRREAR